MHWLLMKSKLTKSVLLLKIADLTNKVDGLTEEEIREIKIFQKAFMKKFISDDDELKGEIDKMISISELELLKELFPEETQNVFEERMETRSVEIAKNMKNFGNDMSIFQQ